MAIRSSQYFLYDSKNSLTDFNISNVNVGTNGLLSEPFYANRTINETKVKGRETPYFSNIVSDPLEFTVSFAFNSEWTDDQIRAVSRWLFTDYYKPLQFSDNPDRIYFAVFVGNANLLHNAASSGYIELNVRCSSPYVYSGVNESGIIDLSTNPNGGTIVSLDNRGDISTFPQIYIEKVGLSDVEIINLSNSGKSTKFTYAIADPTVAPVLSQVSSATPLTATTYYGKYSYSGVSGETKVSPETSFTLASGNVLVMTIPTLPTNALLATLYISTTSGTETKQGTTITTTYTQSTALVTGTSPQANNTTGIRNGENLYIDCENELIISDQINPTMYRFVNFNDEWLELIYGMNNLQILGTCKIRFKYEYQYHLG